MGKLKHILLTILAIFALSVPLASVVGHAGNVQAATKSSQTITIKDEAGDTVKVPKHIKRIAVASLYPLPSVLAVFFNSADKIVGMPDISMTAAKNGLLSDLYPSILKAKTSFVKGTTINTEELKKLHPDVVFYNAETVQQKKQLQNAGFTAVGVSTSKWHYDSIVTLNHWISLLSKMFPQNKTRATTVKNYSNQVYNRVQKRVKTISPAKQQKLFFLFQYSNSAITTAGKNAFGQYWAKAIGAKNVSQSMTAPNDATVNMEQIYKWNPDKILITNFNAAQPSDLYNNKIGNYDWGKLSAVKNKEVTKMPLGMYRSYTPGVDTPITLLWLAKTVYPKQFKDVNITKETKQYYQKVFNVKLTTKQAQKIFKPSSAAAAF